MGEPLDVTSLLRDLGRAIPRARAYAVALRRDPSAQSDIDPYEAQRWVSTQSTLRSLLDMGADPGAPYLAAWVFALLRARVSREAQVAAEIARHAPRVRVTFPEPEEISVRDAVVRLCAQRAAPLRVQLLAALVPCAGEPQARAFERWSRDGELAKRLGLSSPEGPLALVQDIADQRPAARAVLDATDDHAREAFSGARRLHDVLALGAAQDEVAPWPRAMSSHVFADLFRGEAGWLDVPDLELGTTPALIVASSFARAFARFGARWADAASSRELPRALAQSPTGLSRLTMGVVVSSLLLEPSFLGRTLGFSRAEIERTRRGLARVALLSVRLAAARVLLREAAFAGDRRALLEGAEEHIGRALTVPYPPDLTLVLPRLRLDDPARLFGFTGGAALSTKLRDSFDQDWHRNPEAVLHLRDRLGRAPELLVSREDLQRDVPVLAARLGDALADR